MSKFNNMDPFKQYLSILEKYLFPETLKYVELSWNEKHRKYHDINHLNTVLGYIERNKHRFDKKDYDALVLAAFFHDVYYNPKKIADNENESIKRFIASYNSKDIVIKNLVVDMIEATKYRKKPDNSLIKLFWEADNVIFYTGYDKLLKVEKLLRQEFSFVPTKMYKKKRIEFLNTNIGLFDQMVDKDLKKLIKYVETY